MRVGRKGNARGIKWMRKKGEGGREDKKGERGQREKGGKTDKQREEEKDTSNSHSSSHVPAHFVSAFSTISLNCSPGSVFASSFMVATSVAVTCFRNESTWERREAATCVGREGRRQGRTEEGEGRRNDRILYSGKLSPGVKFRLIPVISSGRSSKLYA